MCFLFQHEISEAQILLLVIHRNYVFSSVVVCFVPFFHITSVSQYRHVMVCKDIYPIYQMGCIDIYLICTSDVYPIHLHHYTQYKISNVIISDIYHWIFDIVIFAIPQMTEK